MIRRGEVLNWSASNGQNGSMKIVSVDGLSFEVDQVNDRNRSAGVIRLYGAVVDNGRKAVLIGVGPWKEVWEGTISNDEIVGNVVSATSRVTFRISTARGGMDPRDARPSRDFRDSTFPFVNGKTLRWETGAVGGQNGTFYVTHTSGSSFRLEQSNNKNTAAGLTKLEGEVKDGKFFIYNRQWNETWIGTFDHGVVSGRVNNQTNFRIFVD